MHPPKTEIENIFLPATEKITLDLLQNYQNLDPVIRQLKLWHQYKTKPVKVEFTVLGNKTLGYFSKLNNTNINENTDILEYQTPETKISSLLLSLILRSLHVSHTLNTKGHEGAEKKFKFYTEIVPLKCTNLD